MRPPSIPYFVAQRACTPFSSNGRITFANVAIGRTVDAGGAACRAFRRRDHGVASFLADAFPRSQFLDHPFQGLPRGQIWRDRRRSRTLGPSMRFRKSAVATAPVFRQIIEGKLQHRRRHDPPALIIAEAGVAQRMPFAANTADDRETRPPKQVAAFGELHSGIELAGAGAPSPRRPSSTKGRTGSQPRTPGLNSFEDMSEPPRGAHLVQPRRVRKFRGPGIPIKSEWTQKWT